MKILITGASAGLGKDFAYIGAKEKKNLILVARRKELLKKIQKDIEKNYNVSVKIYALDLTKEENVIKLHQAEPNIDILINNAGFGSSGNFEKLDYQKESDMVALNVKTLMQLTHLYSNCLIKNKGGILNVASVAAFIPGPRMTTYFATKAFVLSFSEALHQELKGKVKVTCLCPGPTKTEFQKVAGFPPEGVESYPVALAGYKAIMKGKAIIIPGAVNKIITFLPRILPRFLVRKLVDKWN